MNKENIKSFMEKITITKATNGYILENENQKYFIFCNSQDLFDHLINILLPHNNSK
jgi:hypothetical protein